MTVNGWVEPDKMGNTLPHEHVLVDFIGADSIYAGRYDPDSALVRALPFLQALEGSGCQTFVECTPQYLGRDVRLLQRLSQESGMNIVTNTGYYGAAGQKYLPQHVFTETSEQIADRWIAEWENGIDGTDVKPGFMKLGADGGPLTEVQRKIMKAGAITHLATGLTIAVHTGNGAAAREELAIFNSNGVAADAFVWVHAQNEKDSAIFREIAGQGAWIEFDGVSHEGLDQYVSFMKFMRAQNLLHRVLLSHDAGWYHVGEPGGGDYQGYTTLFDELLPRLRQEGFTETEIDLVVRKNPAEAFGVKVRRN